MNINIFELLISPGTFDVLINLGIIVLKIVIAFSIVMLHVAYAPYFERKTIGHMQVRLGPMRVGPHGLLQPIADGIKLFFKEDIIPAEADKPVFYISPLICVFAAISSLAVLPFFEGFVIADINIGLLFILAISSLGSYGVIMSGWSSNSKYSFLGGLRSSAQVISYEIAMGLSLVGVMIMAGSLNLTDIVKAQEAYPLRSFLVPQIIGAVIFMIAALAETNRTPFDLPEAESELVAGYFTEYSGIRFGLFFLAEYIGMIVMAVIGSICFLGGWNGPFDVPYVPFFWLFLKVYIIIFGFYWIRATIPRYRYDQLMSIGWKVLIPLALLNIVITATIKILH
jgi:NADH-quinone oxidoreductase subunit H